MKQNKEQQKVLKNRPVNGEILNQFCILRYNVS